MAIKKLKNGNIIDTEGKPQGGFTHLGYAINIFYGYLREELLNQIDDSIHAKKARKFPEDYRLTLTIQPLVILSSYAIENLIKACVLESLFLKGTDEKIPNAVYNHNMSEMMDIVEREWAITVPTNLKQYINSLTETLRWKAKYPNSKQGILVYGVILDFGANETNIIHDIWNLLWSEITNRSPQYKITFCYDKKDEQSFYGYFAEKMLDDFRKLMSAGRAVQ